MRFLRVTSRLISLSVKFVQLGRERMRRFRRAASSFISASVIHVPERSRAVRFLRAASSFKLAAVTLFPVRSRAVRLSSATSPFAR